MKKLFVQDISPGDEVVEFFLVKSKNVATTKNGKPYLDLELQDRTGVINAKMWDRCDECESLFNRGDVIKIKAHADTYKDHTQIKINQIRLPTEKETIDIMDFIPTTDKDVGAMLAELDGLIAGITNPHLSSLLKSFFDDGNFRDTFRKSVAARNIHHSFLGGLLEHTLQVAKLAASCADLYPKLDRDLLITMAILHDVGKVKELESGAQILFTTEGYLLGHISLGLQMLDERIRAIEGFPLELALRIKHVLVSHHGELEFGSPVLPKMPEAIVLHYLDNLDAKVNIVFEAIAKDKNKTEAFTEFHKVMQRNFYKGSPQRED